MVSDVSRAEVHDRELIAGFLAGDDGAFAEVVSRHATLVWGVCRRVLRDASDVEDAFQATFFVLARRAREVASHPSLAGWLHQTARRTALKLRTSAFRRRRREDAAARVLTGSVIRSDAVDPAQRAALSELAALLDTELARLPEAWREVILLTQVEGLSRSEVAQRLGITTAAVKDRLERGRDALRLRLRRRGVALSAAALAAWLVPQSAEAAATTLIAATAEGAGTFATGVTAAGSISAASLAQGVVHMMGLEKLKLFVACILSLLTAGGIAYGMLQDNPQRFEQGLRGHVVEMNLSGDVRNITIRLDEHDALLNLDIAVDAKAWSAYAPCELTEIPAGRFVALHLADDHRTVRQIHAEGTRREMVISEVAASGAIVAIDADDDDDNPRKPEQFQIAADAILRIGDLPATIADLRPGMHVPFELAADGKTINAIEAHGERRWLADGHLLEVDVSHATIRIAAEDEHDQPIERTLPVSAETLIVVDGKAATLADIQPESWIEVRTDVDGKWLRALRARTPEKGEGE